jgi:hypothetical protein
MRNTPLLLAITAAAGLMLPAFSAKAADAFVQDEDTIRFVLESQSSYVFLKGNAVNAPEDDAYSTSAGVARVNANFANGFNLQADVFGEYAWINNNANDTYQSAIGGGLHGYLRNDAGAIGVFGGLADIGMQGTADGLAHTAGVEGLWFAGDATLGAQIGYLDSDKGDAPDMIRDAFYVRGLARYYFAESTLIQAEAAYLSGEMDSDNDDVQIVSLGARIQHELDFFPGDFNWPGKVYVAYRGDFADQDGENDKVKSHTILFGTTFTFGHSLRDNERNGVAMDLPAFARWQGIAGGPLE